MTNHNKDTDKLKSPDIRKILIKNTKIIYKNYKNHLQILEAITIKKKYQKPTINKIAFITDMNIFYNWPLTLTEWANSNYEW